MNEGRGGETEVLFLLLNSVKIEKMHKVILTSGIGVLALLTS